VEFATDSHSCVAREKKKKHMADVEEASEAAASDRKALLPQAFDGIEAGPRPPGAALALAGARPAALAAVASSSTTTAHAPASQSWFAGALHLTAAVVGVGILALPHALAALGNGPGTVALVGAGGVSLYTALLLARVTAAPALGGPATYADVADRVLGDGDGASAARQFVMALQCEWFCVFCPPRCGRGWLFFFFQARLPHTQPSLSHLFPLTLSFFLFFPQPSRAWAWASPTPSPRARPWPAPSRPPVHLRR
jgi:hypothetical protein